MTAALTRFLADERGATALEYGLIGALIFLAIVSAITTFSAKSVAMWNYVSTKIGGSI